MRSSWLFSCAILCACQLSAQEVHVTTPAGSGTGVIISSDGVVATAKHVSNGRQHVTIGGQRATLLEPCKEIDGVEYYLMDTGSKYKYVKIGTPQPGKCDIVGVYKGGVIRYRGRINTRAKVVHPALPPLMMISIPVLAGTSGGPVYQDGKVVGIMCASNGVESGCLPIHKPLPRLYTTRHNLDLCKEACHVRIPRSGRRGRYR